MTTTASEWRIAQAFTHGGVVYSMGEPLPADLTPEELEKRQKEQRIARIDQNGVPRLAGPPVPTTAQEYLFASDILVLRRIRKYRPPRKILKQILAQLDVDGRGMAS